MEDRKLAVVGRKTRKVDGPELVTGKALFTADMRFPGMLYGRAARANTPAALIQGIDVSAALAVPGVVGVLRAEDIPGPNLIGILPPFDQPLLARDTIRYRGESIAFVVAESSEAAKRGAAEVNLVATPLKPVLTLDEAMAPDARPIHPNGNLTFSRKLVKGDYEKGFAEADVTVEGTFETSFQEHAYLEPEAVCAVPGGDGRITVYASCQSPFHLRGHIAANLGVPASRVKVVQAYTGGSFGGKDDVATEIGSLAAISAVKYARPVMVSHDREESIVGSNLRHASRIWIKTGARRDGTITARQVKVLLDGGAYASESPFVTMKALIHAGGPYRVPNLHVEVSTYYTNKTYAGAFRGFGVPQVTFASESQMDELAEKLGMDPLALRRHNALRPGDANATSQVFPESVGLVQTIDKIEEIWKTIPKKKREDDRYLYGTGVSSMLQGISNGAEGVDVVGASVQMSQDGSVLVGIGLTELGQGSRTVFAQIAAEVLGVPIGTITVRHVDTDSVHDSGPTVASRSTTVGGKAVYNAAMAVRNSLRAMAALMFKAPEEMIEFRDGFACLSGVPDAKIPVSQVATAAYWTGFPLMNLEFSKAPPSEYDHETHQGNIYVAYNYGTHLFDIRIDKLTGEVDVLRHTACHDLGRVVNPAGAEGQVQGGSLIGYGLAHTEKILTDQTGRILNPNFADYAVPTMKDRIGTEVLFVEEGSPNGPYGAKGIGEPPVAGAASAFANAVSAAAGYRFRTLPITKEDILRVIGKGASA